MSDPLAKPLMKLPPQIAIQRLNSLLDWYGSQEVYWYKKLWGTEEEREPWNQGTESEWMRYRMEAAALREGIIALGGEPIDTASAGG